MIFLLVGATVYDHMSHYITAFADVWGAKTPTYLPLFCNSVECLLERYETSLQPVFPGWVIHAKKAHVLYTQAVVCFEREEDAEMLRMAQGFEVNQVEVCVIRNKVRLSWLSFCIPNKCWFLETVASSGSVLKIQQMHNKSHFAGINRKKDPC